MLTRVRLVGVCGEQVDETTKDEWVSVQKKTFTRWCNSHLKQRALEIGDLFTDVSDGEERRSGWMGGVVV
jgi:hypothetical protein